MGAGKAFVHPTGHRYGGLGYLDARMSSGCTNSAEGHKECSHLFEAPILCWTNAAAYRLAASRFEGYAFRD